VEFFLDELLDQLLLRNDTLFCLRRFAAQLFRKTRLVLGRIDQKRRARAAALLSRLQHQVKLPLGPAPVFPPIRFPNRRPEGRPQARPEDKHRHIQAMLFGENQINPFLKRGVRLQGQILPQHRLEFQAPRIPPPQRVHYLPRPFPFLGDVAGAADKDADGFHVGVSFRRLFWALIPVARSDRGVF